MISGCGRVLLIRNGQVREMTLAEVEALSKEYSLPEKKNEDTPVSDL